MNEEVSTGCHTGMVILFFWGLTFQTQFVFDTLQSAETADFDKNIVPVPSMISFSGQYLFTLCSNRRPQLLALGCSKMVASGPLRSFLWKAFFHAVGGPEYRTAMWVLYM